MLTQAKVDKMYQNKTKPLKGSFWQCFKIKEIELIKDDRVNRNIRVYSKKKLDKPIVTKLKPDYK